MNCWAKCQIFFFQVWYGKHPVQVHVILRWDPPYKKGPFTEVSLACPSLTGHSLHASKYWRLHLHYPSLQSFHTPKHHLNPASAFQFHGSTYGKLSSKSRRWRALASLWCFPWNCINKYGAPKQEPWLLLAWCFSYKISGQHSQNGGFTIFLSFVYLLFLFPFV